MDLGNGIRIPNNLLFGLMLIIRTTNMRNVIYIVRTEGQVVLDVLKFLALHRTKLGIAQGLRQILLIL